MDIEGSEQVVLNELEASGALQRVKRIHLEYHHHICHTLDTMSDVLALLERNGFGYQIQAHSRAGPPQQHFRTSRFSLIKTNFYQTRPRC